MIDERHGVDLDALMRGRIWLFAVIAIIVIVGARFVMRSRHDAFSAWPRHAMAPGLVSRGNTTRVTVTDEHGPVAGAKIHFRWRPGDELEALTVGPDGSANLSTPHKRVVYATEGSRASRAAWIGDEVPATGIELRLLERGPRLEVTVVDDANRPVPGAAVSVFWTGELASALTGDDGVAHLGPLPPGAVEANVDANGRRGASWVALHQGETTRARVELQPVCELESQLVEIRSKELFPLADAGVVLRSLVDDEPVLSTRTDDEGWFHVIVPSTASFVAQVEADDLVRVRHAIGPGCKFRKLWASHGMPAYVQVVDARGRPLPNIEVKVFPTRDSGGRPWTSGRTDISGRFNAGRLDTTEWTATASFEGVSGQESWSPDGTAPVATLELETETRRVTGRVIDALTGAPIAGATIGSSGESSDGGLFDVRLVGEGRQQREVLAGGYLRGKLVSNRDGEDLAIALERGDWVAGQVVDELGVPIPSFELDGDSFLTVDGRFVVNATSSVLRVSAWGFEPLEVRADDELLGAIALRPQKPLEITVLGPDGGPIAAEIMNAFEPPTSAIAAFRRHEIFGAGSSDDTGRAKVFSPGFGCVLALRDPLLPSSCEVPDGGPMVLQLTRAAHLEGLIFDGHGELSNGRVDLDDAEAAGFADEGHFFLSPITPGPHRVRVRMPSGDSWNRDLTLDAGVTTFVTFSEQPLTQLKLDVTFDQRDPIRVEMIQSGTTIIRERSMEGDYGPKVSIWVSSLAVGPVDIIVTQGERRATAHTTVSREERTVEIDLSKASAR
ncbi:MAG: carboxypeptidase-like regulatory domain-containing protein [Archangium sp.]